MSCHGFGLFEPHQVEDRRRYVGQDTVADRFHAVGNHDDRHRIERMGRIGRAVGIDRIVGVAVIGDLHDLVPVAKGRLDDFGHARIDSLHRFLDRLINSRMPHHIAVGEIQADEIVFLPVECPDQLVGHLVSAHLGLKVVSRHLRRSDQNAVLALELLLAASVQEEGHMSVFLRFGDTELRKPLPGDILANRVGHVLLVEQDMQPLELGVIGVMQQ